MSEEEVRQNRKKKLFTKVKLKTILLLSITLLFNTYAWFLYRTKVSMNLTANVKKWQIEFAENDETITETNFIVATAYPGMVDISKEIYVENKGEIAADIEIEIEKATIFGEGINENLTLDNFNEKFPFKIELNVDNTPLSPGEEAKATVRFSWTYEADNEKDKEDKDALDTEYGIKAVNHTEGNDIDFILRLVAKQHKESSN